MLKKTIFWFHLIVGVLAGLVILVMSVTGVLLAFESQITQWAERSVRFIELPKEGNHRLTIDELAAKAQSAYPDKSINSVTIHSNPQSSVAFNFGRDVGIYFFHPYSGEKLGGESKTHHFLHTIEDFHRWLGNRPIGRPITGAATLLFFLLVCSGLYLWWPRKTTRFNSRLTGNARDWNWHNTIGFWSAPVLLIITISGVVMGYQWANNLVYRLTGNEPPAVQNRPSGREKPTIFTPAVSLDSLQKVAVDKSPNWISITLRYPQKSEAPVTAMIEEKDSIYPAPRSQLSLNSTTGEIVKWEPYQQANAGRKARVWLRYLHTGEAGGIAGQFIAMLASAGAVLLVWTGLAMAWRRWRRPNDFA